jgi:hypothetical protein
VTSTRHRSEPALVPRPGDLDQGALGGGAAILVGDLCLGYALDTVEVAPPAVEVLRELATAAATARCC